MDEKLEDYVLKAVNCIDKESESFQLSNENVLRFDVLKDFLIEKLPINIETLKVSERIISERLKALLNRLKTKDNPLDDFEQEFENLKKEVGQEEISEFTVVFPLNIKYGGSLNPHNFSIFDKEIEVVPKSEWEKNYFPQIEKDGIFKEFIEKSPNKINSSSNNFWKIEYEARDEFFVMDKVEKFLETVLGEINFSIRYGVVSLWHTNSQIWPYRWSDLRHPFIYFIFKDGEFESFHYDKDVSPRKKVNISGPKKEKYNKIFRELPTLSNSDKIDQKLVSAFRAFQKGITEPNIEKSFLEFWRGLENLTMTSGRENTEIVVNRAKSILGTEDPELFEDRLSRLVKKRNDFVHKGLDVRITERDKALTKLLLESMIKFVLDRKNEFSKEDFSFFFQHGTTKKGKIKDLDDLINSKEIRERQLELIQKMIDLRKS